MKFKLKNDKQQLKKWKQVDITLKEDHWSMSDHEVAQSYKLKVAIVLKDKAIKRQEEIIKCQQKLLVDLINKAKGQHENLQAADAMQPTMTFDPASASELFAKYQQLQGLVKNNPLPVPDIESPKFSSQMLKISKQ